MKIEKIPIMNKQPRKSTDQIVNAVNDVGSSTEIPVVKIADIPGGSVNITMGYPEVKSKPIPEEKKKEARRKFEDAIEDVRNFTDLYTTIIGIRKLDPDFCPPGMMKEIHELKKKSYPIDPESSTPYALIDDKYGLKAKVKELVLELYKE